MADFKPSADFVARTMEGVHSYEGEISRKRERINALLLSKPALVVLFASGILFGALHLARIASILISPSLCL